jgi:hypothetical protein
MLTLGDSNETYLGCYSSAHFGCNYQSVIITLLSQFLDTHCLFLAKDGHIELASRAFLSHITQEINRSRPGISPSFICSFWIRLLTCAQQSLLRDRAVTYEYNI